jgi:hypothetical protein
MNPIQKILGHDVSKNKSIKLIWGPSNVFRYDDDRLLRWVDDKKNKGWQVFNSVKEGNTEKALYTVKKPNGGNITNKEFWLFYKEEGVALDYSYIPLNNITKY